MNEINITIGRNEIISAVENKSSNLKSPYIGKLDLRKALTQDELDLCSRTSLIIGVKLVPDDKVRLENLNFLLEWLDRFYGDIFDILIVEQNDKPHLMKLMGELPRFVRYEFIFNPHEYNRGWGYNVAVKNFCENSDVVVLMDTDVLTGMGFVESIFACHREYLFVSPYRNIYYTNHDEKMDLFNTFNYGEFARSDGIRNPVTFTGGIVICRKEVFLAVNGFEQYIGYGAEDRALDVTLINKYGEDKLLLVDEVYIHLFHLPDKLSRKYSELIFNHLKRNYRCQYDPGIGPLEYIHKHCNHSDKNATDKLIKNRSVSFGDRYLYENNINLISVNGQLMNNNIYRDDECLLPILHAAVSDKNYDKAFEVCEVGLRRYKEQTMLNQIFKTKINMLERLMDLANHGAQTASKVITDTLVILGNGPSLKYVMGNPAYRAILKNYDTFGLNAAYRAYDELDFWPTYHGCLDMIVVESHLENYRNILPKLKMMFLLSEDHLGNDIVNFEHPNLTKIRFDQRYRDSNEKIISERFDQFRNWQNSGCNCVQIGLMLGYKRVVLLGMDANYKEVLNEADVTRDDKYRWDHLQITKEVTSNDNYWFSGYQQVGDKYNIPNANKYHLPAWNALGLSDHKDKIVNCTTETKITTITRRSFEEIFNVKPYYLPIRDEYRLKSINPSPENLIGRVISINGLLFYVTEEEGVIVRRFIPEAVFGDLFKNCQNILIIDGDESLLNIPCHGVVNNFAEISWESLAPGLTFMIRAKNERANIYFVLGSLKHILSNPKLRCQVLFVDNQSSDGTYREVIRVCKEQGIKNVFLTSYNVDVCRSGEAHAALTNDQMHRSLDNYYNWCLDRVMTNYVAKWDCDFLALQENLIQLISQYQLHSSDKPLAIWCTGKTLFKAGERYFVNESTMYNEFRIFSKSHGYRWQYAPRWEICSQQYMTSADKRIFSACVFFELKDLGRNEFEFRSHGAAITSDVRDRRDAEIIDLIQSSNEDLIPSNLHRLEFNPLAPANFFSPFLQRYEATLEELDVMQSYWLNVYSRPQNIFRFVHKGNAVIQGLWVGEQVTNFHRLCIESFLRNGHCYVLYTYGPVGNLPEGVVIKDANKIVPSTLIYQYDGSYAGFSDLFRNKLLFDNGGWYVDLDIYCLRPFDIDSEMMFSLDHYPKDAIKARLGTDTIIHDEYYVATNPCKLPAGHDMARSMYATIFKKIVFERIKSVWLGNQTEATESLLKGEVESAEIISALEKLQVVGDFETFVGKLSKLPNKCSFYKLLDTYDVALKDVGQKTWGEIGPIMVTREVVSRGLERYTTKPEMFQGVVKYFEIENFVDRGFDYRTRLQEANPYSLDLFFTMWRRKGLLDKFDTTEDCLLKHIRDLVKEKLDD